MQRECLFQCGGGINWESHKKINNYLSIYASFETLNNKKCDETPQSLTVRERENFVLNTFTDFQ